MEKVISFLDNYYEKARKLSNDFSITRDFDWTPLLILNELAIQVGHIYNIAYSSEAVNEPNRSFTNLGDELSDVFLQLIALADSMNINMYHIKDLKPIKEDNWLAFPVLFGQLNEAVMEKYGFRFNKPRSEFNTTDEFIENRILRLFDITYQIALKYNLDIEKEFQLMLDDANAFLKRFEKRGKKTEYIDTYNEKHEFIARIEKEKAHELGLWHDVVGALIINPDTNEVFFQLKNHKHNNVNDKDLLEITIGGHLQAGEKVDGIVRETKEETGLSISFNDMIQCGDRKCYIDNNMIIREFQHYFLLPMNIDLDNLNPQDDEVIGFVKLDIDGAINVLNNNANVTGYIKTKHEVRKCRISKENFDSAFINNGVFISLLQVAKFYLNENKKRGLRK